jgi:hypothetical protein
MKRFMTTAAQHNQDNDRCVIRPEPVITLANGVGKS